MDLHAVTLTSKVIEEHHQNLRLHIYIASALSRKTSTKMASVMRRPFAVTTCLKQVSKPTNFAFRGFQRSFQTTQRGPTVSPTWPYSKTSPLQALTSARNNALRQAFQQGSKRGYQTAAPQNPMAQGNLTQRLVYGGGMSITKEHDLTIQFLTERFSDIWWHALGHKLDV